MATTTTATAAADGRRQTQIDNNGYGNRYDNEGPPEGGATNHGPRSWEFPTKADGQDIKPGLDVPIVLWSGRGNIPGCVAPGWDSLRLLRRAYYGQGRYMDSGQCQTLRQQICEIGRRLYARGYISGAEGNVSVRVGDGTFLCTPTSISKGFLAPEQVARIDANAQLLEGPLPPSSECRMHLAIYAAQPEAQAVVHAHPAYATALGVANIAMPMNMLAEGFGYMGEVPLLEFQVPGTADLAGQVAGAAERHRVIMMKNHGATAWGESLDHAWMLMEVLEACCKVTYLTRTLGRMDGIPPEKIAQLPRAREVRAKK